MKSVVAPFRIVAHLLLAHREAAAFVAGGPPLPRPRAASPAGTGATTTTALFDAQRRRRPADDDDAAARRGAPGHDAVVTRRAALAPAASGLAVALVPRTPAAAAAADDGGPSSIPSSIPSVPSLAVPLRYRPRLSAYTASYRVGGSAFGAIVDTGSPFLLVPAGSPATCAPTYEWGCFRPGEGSRPVPGLGPTVERFDGNEGRVEWREGTFSFFDAAKEDVGGGGGEEEEDAQSILFPKPFMTFGVASESLLDGPGGIFLGLVKEADDRIRPSFLGQSNVSAFSIDLREREGVAKSLVLYAGARASKTKTKEGEGATVATPPVPGGAPSEGDAIPLVRDLHRRFGDPTVHYVGVASSLAANGSPLAPTSRRDKVYCIFDTGCSGMSVSPSLLDERYAAARTNGERSLWGTVDVTFETVGGRTVSLRAERPIVTPLGSERPWGRRLDGRLVVLGLAFLEGRRTTVDADGGRIWFEG